MKKKKFQKTVVEQVPADYYQKGIKNNLFQRIWHTNKFRAILGLISNSPQKILDVGCASGWITAKIAEKFPKARCYGIDIYNRAIVYGRKLYPGINFKIADVHKLPFKNETFDLAICTEVLEHVGSPKSALLEMKRVLKENGQAVLEFDSGSFLFTITWFVWKKFRGKVWNNAHLSSFNAKKLEKIILSCGFTILKKKKFNLGMAVAFLIKK